MRHIELITGDNERVAAVLFTRTLTGPATGLERRLPSLRIGLELLLTVSRAEVQAAALIVGGGAGMGLVYIHSTYRIACHVYFLAIVHSVLSRSMKSDHECQMSRG